MTALRLMTGQGIELVGNSSPVIELTTFDNIADRIGTVFALPDDITITHVWIRYGARVTGTTPVQYKTGLQGVDGSGLPNGTYLGGGSPASGTFTPPASTAWDATGQWIALDNSYAGTRGEMMSHIVEPVGDPATGPNTSSFARDIDIARRNGQAIPYSLTKDGAAAWTKNGTDLPIYGVANGSPATSSATAVFGYPIVTANTSANFSTAAEAGGQLTMPDICDTFKISGIYFQGRVLGALAKTAAIHIYNDASTPVSQQSKTGLDSDWCASPNSTHRLHEMYFTTLAALSPGTPYNIVVSPQDAAQNCTLSYIDVAYAQDMMALPFGTGFVWTERASGGATAFTAIATRRPMLDLIISDITEPVGGGAGGGAHIIGGTVVR